ncbi:MAG: hypothetical protein J5I93_06190, partial [Pirellulaceae bacterium]|nr:hypothetical protein [Pirellulaceae bacterium]
MTRSLPVAAHRRSSRSGRTRKPRGEARRHLFLERLEDRRLLAYNVSLDGAGVLTVSEANPGDNSLLDVSSSSGNLTIADTGGLTFNAVTGVGAGLVTNNGTSIEVLLANVSQVVLSAGTGNDHLTVNTEDVPTAAPYFSFAGFNFDQTDTPDQAAMLPAGLLPGGQGVVIDSGHDGPVGPVAFPLNPAGFDELLSVGRLLGLAASGTRAVNLPTGNNGTLVRAGIEFSWSGGRSLTNLPGDDLVVYSSSSSPTGPDGFMVQVHQAGGGWSPWVYDMVDARQNYVGAPAEGAFATALDLSDFGLADGVQIDGFRMANLKASDRIQGPGVETSPGSGALVGTGIVIPDDGGATSNVFPDPGPLASFDFFGNSTLDPDPLYIGVLHPLTTAETFNVDQIEIDLDSIEITSGGVIQPPIQYAAFDGLTVNTFSADDTFTVALGGLPAQIQLNGGDPAASDLVVVQGTNSNDSITLQDDNLAHGGSVITLTEIGRLTVDVSNPGTDDTVEVDRSFSLTGNSSRIDVLGNAGDGDELVVNTDGAAMVGGPPEIYSFAGYSFDQTLTPNLYGSLPAGVLDGGAITTSPPTTRTGSISDFPNTLVDFEGGLSIGRLFEGSSATSSRALNLPAGNNGTVARSGFVVSWDAGRSLTNFTGQDDFVIYESASSMDGVEAFMVQVHDPNTNMWSPWIYQPATSFGAYGGGPDGATATPFNLDDFGIAPGGVIDEIRVVNMRDEDRMVSPSGIGQVIPEDNGSTSSNLPQRGPLNPGFGYPGGPMGSLDPDPLYVGVLHALGVPAGTSDRVVVDPQHVQIDGHLPINYQDLDLVTVNTEGNSDTLLVTPSTTTQYSLHGGDPTIASNPGDALLLDLTGVTSPVVTVTGESAGTLSSSSHADADFTGIDYVDSAPPFALVVSGAANPNGPADDDFLLQRSGAAIELTVNGQLVFRGDLEAVSDLTVNGSADDDTLTVDFATGNPIPTGGVAYNGAGGANDLVLNNGSFDTITHTHTSSSSGSIALDISSITYTGTTLIDDNLAAANRLFVFDTGGGETIVVEDDGGDPDGSRISGTNSATVNFHNPSATFQLDAGLGNDTINFQQVDNDFDPQVSLNGQAGDDVIRIDSNGPAPGGTVDFVTFPINVDGGGDSGDDLIIEDSSDLTGDWFSITSTQVGGDGITPGAAVNSAVDPAPVVDGALTPMEWDHVLLAFDSGARLGPDQQTVLHFPFDEGGGSIAFDSTDNNNDGLLVPLPGPKVRPGMGKWGGALEFDGVDDFAWFQDATFNVGAAGSLALWFNVDTLGQRQMFAIGPETQGLEFQLRHSNDVYFYTNRDDGDPTLVWSSTLVQPTGVWQHVTYTWDKSLDEGRIYLNGVEVAYRAGFDPNVAGGWNNVVNTVNQLMNVGYDPLNGRYVDGRMDDLAWYDRALTPAEIGAIANPGGNGVPDGPGMGSGLLAYWDFDGPANQPVVPGSGGTTIDLNLTPPLGPNFMPGAGQFGGALKFDGIDDFAFFQDPAFDVGEQGTLNFWVNMDNQSRRNQFFEGPGNSGFEFQYRSNSGGQFFGTPNSGNDFVIQSGGAGGTTGVWTNLQYTWDFATKLMRIYRDGTELTYLGSFNENIANWTSVVNTVNGMMNVGRDPGDSSRFFDGLMDDIAWFDTVLSGAQRDELRTVGVTQAQTNLGGGLNPVGLGGNLVAHWNLDDAPGTTIAPGDSGTSIDLILQLPADGVEFNPSGGPTLPGSGATLDSVDFDGDGDFIQVADSPSLDFNKNQGTIALWVKPRFNDIDDNIATGSATLVEDNTEQVELGISWRANSGLGDLYRRVFFYPHSDPGGNDLIVSNSRLAFDQWTHVAVTWDIPGGTTRIFINGQDDGFLVDNTGSITPAGNTGDWILGGDAGFALDRWFDGEMADVTILNTPLSASEIESLYKNGAQSTGPFDLSGAKGRFAWDDTNLYGLVESYPAGPGDSNGPFADLQLELFINGSMTTAVLLDTTLPFNGVPGSVVAGNGPHDFFEFSIPLAAIDDGLNTFDPTTDYLQYRLRTIDADVPGAGFDTRDTQLQWVIEPPETSGGLRRMDFVETEGLFGLGGGLTYAGFQTLTVNSSSGDDTVDVVNTHAGVTTLNTGDGQDQVHVLDTSSGSTFINGGDQVDVITVDGTGTGGVDLDGQEDDDDFFVNLGDVPGAAVQGLVRIGDTGVNDVDQARIEGGATLDDTFLINHFLTVRNGTETVQYDTNLEELTIVGQAGDDTFDVTPSSATEMFIEGGPPAVPPGDHLIYNAGGGVANDDGLKITSAGVKPVNYIEIERITLNNADITVDGSGLDDILEVTATSPGNGSYVLTTNAVPGPTVSFLNIAGLTFNGLAGDDKLIIHNPPGAVFAPTRGIVYNGGDDDDSLELTDGGGAAFVETYSVGPQQNAGTISFEGPQTQTIFFTGLEPISDNVPVASLAIHASPGNDTINVIDGPVFAGDQTVEVNFGPSPAPYELMRLANKPHVTLNGTAGDDTINVGYTTKSAGLLTFTVNGDGRDPVADVELNNSTAPPPPNPNITLGTQNVDLNGWNTSANANITMSTTIPHLSILGTGDGTFDYYSFLANPGDLAWFDIDGENFDTELFLYDANGNLIAQNDNGPGDAGDGAATASFISHTFASSGLFVIGVGKFDSSDAGGIIAGTAPAPGDSYTLHLSVQNHGQTAAPDPIAEVEPNNSTPPPVLPGPNPNLTIGVQHIDNSGWNTNADPQIVDSTLVPHVSIQGTGDGSFDYYSFTAAAGDRVILDVDGANFAPALFLFDSQGNLQASDPSLIDTTLGSSGTFIIGIGRSGSFNASGFLGGPALAPGDVYTLHVSVANHAAVGDDTINIQSVTPADVVTTLNGNEQFDQFVFASGAVLTGTIDGGTQDDVIDWSALDGPLTVNLNGLGSLDGFRGDQTTTISQGLAADGFDNIDALVGSKGSDTLQMDADLRTHWDIGGAVGGFGPFGVGGFTLAISLDDTGVLIADEADLSLTGNALFHGRPEGWANNPQANPIAPNAAGEDDLAWSGFENLVGAANADDRFDLRDAASITGTIDGRGHDVNGDSLDYRDWTTSVVVNLGSPSQAARTATSVGDIAPGVGGDVGNSIENVFGGNGDDNITGDQDDNILGDGHGSDSLDGGWFETGVASPEMPEDDISGDDTFLLEPGLNENGTGASSDVITDLNGNDTVDFRFADARMMIDMDLLDTPQDVLHTTPEFQYVTLARRTEHVPISPSMFENVVGGQFNDIISIDPLAYGGDAPENGPPVPRNVHGNDPFIGGPDDGELPDPNEPIPPGDTLLFEGSGQEVLDTGFSITAAGIGTVTYQSIETLLAPNQRPRIIDNGDAQFLESPITATDNISPLVHWNPSSTGGYQDDYLFHYSQQPPGPQTTTWTFQGVQPGKYRVAVTWPSNPSHPISEAIATDAPFTVFDDDFKLATIDVNQFLPPGSFVDEGVPWQQLGIFNVSSHTLVVQLSDLANGQVLADAVRIERLTEGPELTVLAGNGYLDDGSSTVDMTTTIGNPLIRQFTVRNDGTATLVINDIDLAAPGEVSPTTTPPNLTLAPPAPGFPLMIAPGNTFTFTVTLDALTDPFPGDPNRDGHGDFPGEIRIFSNDLDENVIAKNGAGVNPNPDDDPNSAHDPFTFQIRGVVSNRTIIDNGDAGFQLVGIWPGVNDDGFQDDLVAAPADNNGERALWTFNNLPDGIYRVSTTYAADTEFFGSTAAPFTVSDINGQIGATAIDQSMAPQSLAGSFQDEGVWWVDLGGPYTVTGGQIVVRLLDTVNQPTRFILADAVRIERLLEDKPGIPHVTTRPDITVEDGLADVADDTGVVEFGPTWPGTPVIKTFTIRNDGGAPLVVREPISLPPGFTLLDFIVPAGGTSQLPTGMTQFVLNPGDDIEMRVRLDAGYPGTFDGELSFPTGDLSMPPANADPDETPFNFHIIGTVNRWQIIDDQDASGFSATSGFELASQQGLGSAQGFNSDVHFVNADDPMDPMDPDELATWTFD